MRIALIGYGKIGKEIEKMAIEMGHSIGLIIDINNLDDFTPENLKKNDVAIEFTSPHHAVDNIIKCLYAGIPVVSGTTGWKERFQEVNEICMKTGGTLFHSSNFSPGVNIMFAVNKFLANIMEAFPQYDVSLTELHHTEKLDAPSGTAICLAEQIIEMIKRKKNWTLEDSDSPENLRINAIREGDIKGTHEVIYDSEIDFISVKHVAKSRKGFAIGAIKAAEFSVNRKGVFTMTDLLGI